MQWQVGFCFNEGNPRNAPVIVKTIYFARAKKGIYVFGFASSFGLPMAVASHVASRAVFSPYQCLLLL